MSVDEKSDDGGDGKAVSNEKAVMGGAVRVEAGDTVCIQAPGRWWRYSGKAGLREA